MGFSGGSSPASKLLDYGGAVWDIRNSLFGGKCDGQAAYTGQAVSGSNVLTDPSGGFTSALIGKTLTVPMIGWTGIITNVLSPTQLTVSTNSPANSQVAASATGAIVTGHNNLTDPGGAFSAAWDGAIVVIQGAGAGSTVLTGQLQAVASATSLFLCQVNNSTTPVNAGTTVAAGNYTINLGEYYIGTDDTAAWNAAFAKASQAGVPVGIHWSGVTHITPSLLNAVPFNVRLSGDNKSAVNRVVCAPVHGSVMRAHGAVTAGAMITFGPGTSGYLESQVSASATWCTFDGGRTAAGVVLAAGNQNYFDNVSAMGGTAYQWKTSGGTGQTIWNQCTGCGIGTGDVLQVQSNDCQWYGGFLRSAVNQVHITNAVDFKMIGAHLFSGYGDSNLAPGTNVLIDTGAAGSCSDIEFGNCDFDDANGPNINLVPGTNGTITDINVVGCQVYQNPSTIFTWPNNTFPVYQANITAAGSTISRFNVFGGSAISNVTGSLFTAFLATVGATGTLSAVNVCGFTSVFCNAFQTGTAPTHPQYDNTLVYNGVTFFTNPNGGTFTATGDGATTAFSVNHNLGSVPTVFMVQPSNATTPAIGWVTATSTQITVHFAAAPGNAVALSFIWWGKV